MKRMIVLALVLCLVYTFNSPIIHAESANKPKNVIIMVMDGSSSSAVTLARWYKGNGLALDELVSGGVRTYSAIAASTDSAAAATALATGHKTEEHYIGLLPSRVQTPGVANPHVDERERPIATILEAAQLVGKATGLVATAEIQHATPAGFSAHVKHRKQLTDIAEQQVYQEFDVVLGGGREELVKNNLVPILKEKGYEVISTRQQLQRVNGTKLWGAFSHGALAYEMDRKQLAPSQPSLVEMTEKAIEVLKQDSDGFVLFVEGSKVDWAAHKNDPIGMISEILAFDKAVGEAVSFAKEDGQTVVIAVTDHGNSGLSIGNQSTSKTYASTPVSAYVGPLKGAKLTVVGALTRLKHNRSNLVEVLESYGLSSLSNNQIKHLMKEKNLDRAMAALLAERAQLGFTSYGHTGEDVFLYSYGPGRPTGLLENTEIAKSMAALIGVDLKQASIELFVDIEKELLTAGFQIQSLRNPKRLCATNGRVNLEFIANQNIMKKNGEIVPLEGVIVSNGHTFFAPRQVLKEIQ